MLFAEPKHMSIYIHQTKIKYECKMKAEQYNYNKVMILLNTILLASIFIGCKDYITSYEKLDELNYPTVLHSLSESQVQQLQKEFDNLNNNKICSQINNYGFLEAEICSGPSFNDGISEDDAKLIAASCLVENSKFTNTNNKNDLLQNVHQVIKINEDGSKWKVTFGPQKYNDCEIPFSFITVWITGEEVYEIDGHWYSNAYIPHKFKYQQEEAKEKIVGEKITWFGFGTHELTITEEVIEENITKAIVPIENEDNITLHLTWKIPILYSDFIGWHVYFDVMTGEIVNITQEFMT